LNGVKGDSILKSPEVKPESLVWGMVAVLVFGFGAIVFLMMAMKMVGLNVGQILAFMVLSFLIIMSLEGVFLRLLLRSKRGGEKSADTVLLKEQSTNELDEAHARALPEPMASVTEHTTRRFEPLTSERKSK